MAPRAYWKGHVRLSLVSFPVQLIPAIDSKERVTFHRVHKQTGQRVRYQSVVPDQGPVENEDIGKGYEYEKGRFVVIEDDEINKLKLESLAYPRYRSVRRCPRDRAFLLRKAVLRSPLTGPSVEDTYRVVRDAMRDTNKVAIGQLVLSTKERIVALITFVIGACCSKRCATTTRCVTRAASSPRSARGRWKESSSNWRSSSS